MKQRLKFAAKIAGWHFLVSACVAALLAAIVFFVWYPYPLRGVTGSFKLFLLIVCVDVVCGPFLTFILSSPKKPRKEMWLDLSLIALIQLSAFIYGMYHIFEARPVAVVFEVDRLRALTPKDIATDELAQAPQQFQKLPWFSHFLLSTRKSKNGDDTLDAVSRSLQGFDIGQRPSWWIAYTENTDAIKKAAVPVSQFSSVLSPADKIALQEAINQLGVPKEQLLALPLTSAKSQHWTALLDEKLNIIGAVNIDAFNVREKLQKK